MVGIALCALALTGCGDILEVTDPDRYTSADLDQALDAVAAGVEGDLYEEFDMLALYAGLTSDELQHTGTWTGYDDYDHGRFLFGAASGGGGGGGSDGVQEDLMQTRQFARDAQERFERVLESAAATSPLMARVKVVEGWADLLIGQFWCEAPLVADGPAVPDTQVLEAAVAELTEAMQVATTTGETDYALWAQAGRARANLLLGNYDAALADARAIPEGFVWSASFSSNSGRQENDIVNLITAGFNRAAGMREKWWPVVDVQAMRIEDPWTGTPDPRLPVNFDGATGVDGVTDHYSQWKFTTKDDDIEMTDWKEMRLIEAEILWRRGDLEGAMALLNQLRTAVGLAALPTPSSSEQVFEYLLHERLAETFMEGQRMSDLQRFGLVDEFIANGAFGTQTFNPRPVKFPLSEDEAEYNPEIENDASLRCLPMSD